MSKNENNENLKIGNVYKVTLTSEAVMMGVLFCRSESLIDNTVVNEYGISFDQTTYVHLRDTQIEKIEEAQPIDTDYFMELENNYNIKCFDSDGELLPASRILSNVVFRDNNLEKLSKKERQRLIKNLYCTNKDIVDIIEAFLVQKEENDSLHKEKLSVLDAISELVDNYNRIMKKRPYAECLYNLIFKELGVEKFIKQIC